MKKYLINGIDRPFCLGYAAMLEYADLYKGHKSDPENLIYLMAYIGFKHGNIQTGQDPALIKSSDVKAWLDQDFFLATALTKDVCAQMEQFSKVMSPYV